MPQQNPPAISHLSVVPASGPGGTVFSASVVTGEVAPLAIAYQWRLDGRDITGATGQRHVATAAGALTVLATVTGNDGVDGRESAPVTVFPGVAAPEVTEARIVPGGGGVGDRFTAVAAAQGVPVPDLAFSWLLDGVEVPGATGPSHTATAPGSLVLRVTARNAAGAVSRESAPVAVGAAPSAPVVLGVGIEPSGGRVGDTFTAVASVIGLPVPALSFQWLLDGQPIAGATGATYVPATVGALSVRATATNSQGSDSAESAAVAVDAAPQAPVVLEVEVEPSEGRVGDSFTAIASATGDPVPALSFQWLLDGQPIPGATGGSHTPASAGALSVRATATNSRGSDSAESVAVTVAAALVPPAITSLVVGPAAGTVGQIFVATAVATGEPAPELGYQWALNGAPIPGAVGASHVASAVGTLSVTVTATSVAGTASAAASAQVAAPALKAPVAAGRLVTQTFTERTGIQAYDVSADFSVEGDAALASVSWSLVGVGDEVFTAGVFEAGVLVANENGQVRIDARGVVTIDTDRSGLIEGVPLTVRASNAAGSADSVFGVTVAAAGSGGGDTDPTPEILLNGDFSQGAAGWVTNIGVTIDSGAARFNGAGVLRQSVPLEGGALYAVDLDVPELAAGRFRISMLGGSAVLGNWITTAGVHRQLLTAATGNNELRLSSATGSRIVVESVSVRKVS